MLTVLLALDLGVFNRTTHKMGLREALGWSAFWVALGLAFGAAVYFLRSKTEGVDYFTAYIVEKSLSVDNLFVMAVIFKYFKVDAEHQHRVLFWGIIGALIMRAVVIFAGIGLLTKFAWTEYLFGAFLVYTGVKMIRDDGDDDDFSPDGNIFVRIARRLVPITDHYRGTSFLVREPGPDGRLALHATPLFVVLLVIESADMLFAVDSIPAVLAISRDHFVVLTSNIFAILGLRALYFVLADVIDRFHYLKVAVCVILIFVGAKMVAAHVAPISTTMSLTVIVSVLTLSTVLSVYRERRQTAAAGEAGILGEHAGVEERPESEEEFAGP